MPPDPPPGLSQVEVWQWRDQCYIEKNDKEPEITDKKMKHREVVEDTESAYLQFEDMLDMIEY